MKQVLGMGIGEARIPLSAKDQTVFPSSYLLYVHCSGWFNSCVCVHLKERGGVTNGATAARKEKNPGYLSQ